MAAEPATVSASATATVPSDVDPDVDPPGRSPDRGWARPPGWGPLGWLRWGWRQLTSMRTALLLLLLLAVAAVPGSLLPQRSVDPEQVAAYARAHPDLFPVLVRLGLFDVYTSVWFSAVYLLLMVSLVGCIIPRTRHHLLALTVRPAPAPRSVARLPGARVVHVPAAPEAVLARAAAVLRGERFRVAVRRDADGGHVAAEKGYLRETGNLFFHVALLLLLLAVAWGSLGGFTAGVVVPEGRGFSNAVVQYDAFRAGRRFDPADLKPFTIALDRLDVRYEEAGPARGAPRDFAAHVRVREGADAAARPATVRPNAPLVLGGTKVFLLGNGYAPRFTVRDGRGDVVLQGPVTVLPDEDAPGMASTGVLKLPDARPEPVGLTLRFLPTAVRAPVAGPVSVFPDARNPRVLVTGAYRGDLGLDRGAPQSVYRLDTSGLTPLTTADRMPVTAELAPGQSLTLPDGLGTVTFDGVARFANFSVAANAGRRPALAAVGLALAGLLAMLYVRRRRVWVRATASSSGPGGRSGVEVGGLTKGGPERLAADVDRLVDDLTTTLGAGDEVGHEPSCEPSPVREEGAWSDRLSRR